MLRGRVADAEKLRGRSAGDISGMLEKLRACRVRVSGTVEQLREEGRLVL